MWNIYQVYWGRHQQDFYKKCTSARLLKQQLCRSLKMKALSRLMTIFRLTCHTNTGYLLDETFENIKNMSEACLGEEEDIEYPIEPILRMHYHIHSPVRAYCRDIYQREWFNLQNHNAVKKHQSSSKKSLVSQYSHYLSQWKMSYSPIMDDSIHRVSSIIALF